MPLHIEDQGSGNTVTIGRAEHAALGGRIVFTGHGANISIGPACLDTGLRIEAGSGVRVTIGAANHLGGLFIHAAAGSSVIIGDRCGFNGLVRLLLHEPASIVIGDDSLVSSDVDITVSDMHPIFDAASRKRINPADDVRIGRRVWIGQRALILKGATIGEGSVIGAAAVVTGAITAGCVAAGNPARVIRRGIAWQMDL